MIFNYEHLNDVISQMEKSTSEEGRVSPRVGALLVRDGTVVAKAYRGEVEPGEHAEYTLLEKKLAGVDLKGTTLYTTLEPCTARNAPKAPCANRIIDRGIRTVVVGTLDPNPEIMGKRLNRLREAGLEIALFPGEMMSRVEEANADFRRLHRLHPDDAAARVDELSARSLDGWFRSVNQIYAERNSHLPLSYVLAHLVEIIGGLSCLASEKSKASVDPAAYIQKAVAWWLALCGKAGIRSVEALILRKFPGVCPYCEQSPHDDDRCREVKARGSGADWRSLSERAEAFTTPMTSRDWLLMFRTVYPVQQSESYALSFGRLTEELGELAEAVRLFEHEPRYFLSEAADVFAWIMRIENIRESKAGTKLPDIGQSLNRGLAESYPDVCRDCEARPCRCPLVLQRTVGRIATEVPVDLDESGIFLSPDERRAMFRVV